MEQFKKFFFFIFVLSLFWGCAAAGVPYTSDPHAKIGNANYLLDVGRPLPAERLIFEAMDAFQKEGNRHGMADAQWTYGLFLSSVAVESMKKHYREKGFRDVSVNFDNRFRKSIEYLEKAKVYYVEQKEFGPLTNIYFKEGYCFMKIGDNETACKLFKESLIANKKFFELNPKADIILPKGYANFESFVQKWQKEANCI
ncbi:MAG: hypothetical protein ABSF13_04380 [Smithella sp.]